MKLTVSLGSSPWGETCAQVGQPGYDTQGPLECEAFKAQLLRHYAATFEEPLPKGAEIQVKACPHDFGTYYEVHGVFDDSDTVAGDAIMWLESNSPELWDTDARDAVSPNIGDRIAEALCWDETV